MQEKQCQYCKVIKPFSEFNLNRSRKDGHQKYCKECNKMLNRKYKERKAASKGRIMKEYEPKKYSTVTDEELLQFIRDFYKEYKRAPVTSDFENNKKYPHFKTYYRHFKYYKEENKLSSWNDILELAGVSPLNMRDLWSSWQYLVEKSAQLLEGNCLFQYCGFSSDFKPDIYIPSQNKIIDAATSDYRDKHKLAQYEKGISYVDNIEYWCLNRDTVPGYDLPRLKYVYSDEIISRLDNICEFELSKDIKNLYQIYEDFGDTYIKHRKKYIIDKLNEFFEINGRAPYHKELFHNPNYPSATTICTVFGSFNTALTAAGLEINRKGTLKFNKNIAKDDLLNFILENKRLPLIRELGAPNTTFTNKVYSTHWGGIKNCAKELNNEIVNKYISE